MGNSELWEIGFYGIWKLGGPDHAISKKKASVVKRIEIRHSYQESSVCNLCIQEYKGIR